MYDEGKCAGGEPTGKAGLPAGAAATSGIRPPEAAKPVRTPEMTIREAWMQASSFLRGREIEDGESSAEWLLEHVLECTRSELFMRWNEPFPAEMLGRWRRLLERRAAGEPVQYITGEQEFYGLPFRVTPAVLIPRPETELLVEQMVGLGRKRWPGGSPLVADIGSGSGAISVTIAVQCPGWRVTASDISADALDVARCNAVLNGVGERMTFYLGDLLEAYIRHKIAIDVLVSNPPYIETGEIARLQPEVRLHEPVLALDGGPDGLRFYRRIVEQIEELPAPPGLIGFEVGQGQAEKVAELLQTAGHWDEIALIPDLAGILRHVIGSRKK